MERVSLRTKIVFTQFTKFAEEPTLDCKAYYLNRKNISRSFPRVLCIWGNNKLWLKIVYFCVEVFDTIEWKEKSKFIFHSAKMKKKKK